MQLQQPGMPALCPPTHTAPLVLQEPLLIATLAGVVAGILLGAALKPADLSPQASPCCLAGACCRILLSRELLCVVKGLYRTDWR